MLFTSKREFGSGCLSAGVIVCGTLGFNAKKWSA